MENGIKGIRKAAAGGSDTNIGLNTVLATAMNAGVIIASKSPDPLLGPVFAYMEGLTYMVEHPVYAKYFPVHDDTAVVMTMVNTDLGGFSFFQLASFMYAGHQDPATECLALLKKVWDEDTDMRQYIAGWILLPLSYHGMLSVVAEHYHNRNDLSRLQILQTAREEKFLAR